MRAAHSGILLALALGALAPPVAAEGVTPVQKVTELLGGMLEHAKKERHEEQVQFSTYKQWCDDTAAEKEAAIEAAELRMKELKADIAKLDSEANELAKAIVALQAAISGFEGDIKAATKVRGAEKGDYVVTRADYSESVDAIERAIDVLKKQDKITPASAAFVQLSALAGNRMIPKDAQQKINKFLAQDPEAVEAQLEEDAGGLDEAGAPEANVYEFQSGGVIDMLEKLLDKFIDERTELEKDEISARHAYDMTVADLKGQITLAEQDLADKQGIKAKKLADKAAAEMDLQETAAAKVADKTYLDDLNAACKVKASNFADRQQLRAQEIGTLEKVIEIVSSGDVAGNSEKHLPQLLQARAQVGVALLAQLRSTDRSPLQERVSHFLAERATEIHSRVLSAIAVRAEADPFKKVKKMIQDLIVKLMEEASSEASHKAWCDTELATNAHTRKEKTNEVETLTAAIDQLQVAIAELKADVAELSKAIAELDAAMAKATTMRDAEKATNAETIADAVAAQTAVAQAVVLLKEFYAGAAEATALMQRRKNEPEVFDSAYKGQQGSNTGVIGMLEVIESDFARLEAETKAAEKTAQKEYDDFITDTSEDKSSKESEMDHKSDTLGDTVKTLTTTKLDLEDTHEELDAAIASFDKLKPACVETSLNFDERVEQRRGEIQSLKEALDILEGTAI